VAGAADIKVDVEYLGLIARYAGREDERFTLPEGANVQSLVTAVLARHETLNKGKGALFVAVNKKALPSHPPAWREHTLLDGDRVVIGVKIIGG
jgi:molybdopterin converting factor small subunit